MAYEHFSHIKISSIIIVGQSKPFLARVNMTAHIPELERGAQNEHWRVRLRAGQHKSLVFETKIFTLKNALEKILTVQSISSFYAG